MGNSTCSHIGNNTWSHKQPGKKSAIRSAPSTHTNTHRSNRTKSRARGSSFFFKRGRDLVDVIVGYRGAELLGSLQDGRPV